MAGSEGVDLARLHWRRQLELTVAGVAVGLVAFRLLTISVQREANVRRITLVDGRTIRDASYLTTLWPAALGLVALAALTAVVLVHVFRVAAFTFRSQGDTP
jgi:hypothetical protein